MNRTRRVLNRVIHASWRFVDRYGVIAPGTHAAEEFGTFGAASAIDFPPATILNPGSMHVGSGVLVGRHVTLSVGYGVDDPRAPKRGLVIGDRAVIGARSSITAHESIEIGDDVFFGQSVFVTDTSHGYQDPQLPIGQQFGTHMPVSIGPGSWIGHGAVVLPGAQIGRNCVVAAGAVVRGHVADFSVVAGNPARLIRQLDPDVGWIGHAGDVRPVLDGDLRLQAPAPDPLVS